MKQLNIEYFILSLMTEERMSIINQNIQKFPYIKIFKSINGYNKEETIQEYRDSGLQYRSLDHDFETYGTLANFLTKYNILQYQVEKNIPYLCFLEDDLVLGTNFITYTEQLTQLFHNDYIKILRLGEWGEGYITSLDGARFIVENIKNNGIIRNIDNQLRYHSGTELYCYDTPWKLVIPTNEGDCLKTEKIVSSDLNSIKHIYHQPQFGEDWFDYKNVYDYFTRIIRDGGHIVEVGSWKGKSSSYLAVNIMNTNKKIKFDCIDTWKGSNESQHINDQYVKSDTLYDLFLDNIKPVGSVINPIRMTSIEASQLYKDNSIDIVFLDACHEYECLIQDIKAWLPKIKKGGIIGGHDYTPSWPGVMRAVDESFENKKIVKIPECSSWIYYN